MRDVLQIFKHPLSLQAPGPLYHYSLKGTLSDHSGLGLAGLNGIAEKFGKHLAWYPSQAAPNIPEVLDNLEH